MKPFNLEDAKAGKPVCTRDGRDVRILCFDRKHEIYSIIGLVLDYRGIEIYHAFFIDGTSSRLKQALNTDLFMKTEKKEGWINIYPGNEPGSNIFKSKEAAIKEAMKGVVDTVRIEWEE